LGTSNRMKAEEVRRFIEGKTIQAFDPDSKDLVATVDYRRDGTCAARFPTGESDTGRFGFIGDRYWTQYTRFRGGGRNEFYLVEVDTGRAQAFYADGRRAFLQAPEGITPFRNS
jgi:hypothetical protein